MDLRAASVANLRRNRAATCPVVLAAEALSDSSEPTRAQWIEAANDDSIPAVGLVRVVAPLVPTVNLTENGFGRHRRYECKCRPKPAPVGV